MVDVLHVDLGGAEYVIAPDEVPVPDFDEGRLAHAVDGAVVPLPFPNFHFEVDFLLLLWV